MKTAIEYARDDLGTWEWSKGHNPKVVQYFADVGHDWVKDDETAWCAAFVGAMLAKAGLPHTGALNARSYLKWGESVRLRDAREGDVVIFARGNSTWQGHVAFFISRDGDNIFVLGGNQSNQVKVSSYSASRLLGVRRMQAPEPIIHEDPQSPPADPALGVGASLAAAIGALSIAVAGWGCNIPLIQNLFSSCGG